MSLDRIREIILDSPYGMVATSVDGQPRLRPMAFILREDGTLWSSTYDVSGKVAEFRSNPRVAVAFVNSRKVHVRIEGTVHIDGGPEKKSLLLELNPKVGRHFSGGDDPKFVHVEIRPTRIRWTEPGFSEYHEVPLPVEGD